MADEKRSCLLMALILAVGIASCTEDNGGGAGDGAALTTDSGDSDDDTTSDGAKCPTPPLKVGRYLLEFDTILPYCHVESDQYPAGPLIDLTLELRVSAEQGTLLCLEGSGPPADYGCNGMALSSVGTEEEPMYRLQGAVWELLPSYWIEFDVPPHVAETRLLVRLWFRSAIPATFCNVHGGAWATIVEKP